MRIKTYCGGYYLKACNTITYWAINRYIFIELNQQGLKSLIYDSLHNFQEGKHIFQIDYEPNLHFPNVEDQNQLEKDRIFNEIRKFLIDNITKRRFQ